MRKKKTTKASGKERTLKADKKLFAELMLVGSTRKVPLEEMLKHHLRPLPLSISSIHGALVKTNKASLLHHLKGLVKDPFVGKVLQGSVWVLDGKAILQQLKPRENLENFGDLAQLVFGKLIRLAVQYRNREVHFVTDRYPAISIKTSERSRRAESGSKRSRIYSGETSNSKTME